MYINSELSFRRCFELEGKDSNVMIIDLMDERKTRLRNVYRTFNPVGMTARNKFIQQLKVVKHACTNNSIIHIINNRATPERFLIYKHALALFRLYTSNKPSLEWCALHFNQIITSRQTNFRGAKSNRLKVGLNALAIRLFILNGQLGTPQLA